MLKSGVEKWCCSKRTCTAKLYVISGGGERTIVKKELLHNHESDVKKIVRQIASASCKRKAEEDILIRPTKVCHTVLRDLPEIANDLDISDISCVKRNIYNVRRKRFPPLPKSITDVHSAVDATQWVTSKGEHFVMMNNREDNLIIFSCISNLIFLCTCDVIYLDGTFTYCTKYFKQLFTLHGYKNGHYVPSVFCLINNKTVIAYESCFKQIINVCKNHNLQLKPAQIVIDFEKSIHVAVSNVWQDDTAIVGCRFHLSQAWWRKLQQLGLSTEYTDKESEIGKFLMCTWLAVSPTRRSTRLRCI